jgi:hypothetical protein
LGGDWDLAGSVVVFRRLGESKKGSGAGTHDERAEVLAQGVARLGRVDPLVVVARVVADGALRAHGRLGSRGGGKGQYGSDHAHRSWELGGGYYGIVSLKRDCTH